MPGQQGDGAFAGDDQVHLDVRDRHARDRQPGCQGLLRPAVFAAQAGDALPDGFRCVLTFALEFSSCIGCTPCANYTAKIAYLSAKLLSRQMRSVMLVCLGSSYIEKG